ncbi:ATP-binding protein [Azotosporobacter soli]|uniref:ATP-binding protein n=1 Tax=Azotosporobacter soli TaxID=3055040 RepID=UPI0031FF18F7
MANSIRNKLAARIFIAGSVIGLIGFLFTYNMLARQVTDNYELQASQVAVYMRNYLEEDLMYVSFNDISSLAKDARMAEMIDKIGGKVYFDGNAFARRDIDPLADFLKWHTRLQGICIGTQQGGYIEISERPLIAALQPYEPRERPWYKDALATPDRPVLTGPYRQMSGGIAVAVSKAVVKNNETIGVVSFNLDLGGIEESIQRLTRKWEGDIEIISGDGTILFDRKHKARTLKNTNEAGVDAGHAESGFETIVIEGREQRAWTEVNRENGWKVVTAISTQRINEQILLMIMPILVAYLAALLSVILVVCGVVQIHVVNLIDRINRQTKEIATGNLAARIAEMPNDEIGKLGESFNAMAQKLELNIASINDANKQLLHMDRLNTVAEMAASIAHEVRNPMTTIRGFLQLMRSKETDAKKIAFCDLMIEELDRANSIITEFLSLSKNKEIYLQEQRLEEIIRAIYPLLQSDAAIGGKEIVLQLADSPPLMLDEKEIRQLILNLSRNGLEAMEQHGKLTIATSLAEDGSVMLTIQDEGGGIPAEIMENIGVPFKTTKDTGTGLGLAVCYGIAARHNAYICVKTGLEGTTFYVQFPVRHAETE